MKEIRRAHIRKRSPVQSDYQLVKNNVAVGNLDADLQPEAGDILLTWDAKPAADSIQLEEDRSDFQLEPLRDYLAFLELVVLNERIVVVHPRFEDESRRLFKKHAVHFDGYQYAGTLDLELPTEYELKKRGIMVESVIVAPNVPSPEKFLERHLQNDDALRKRFRMTMNKYWSTNLAPEVETLARLSLADSYGRPLYVSECARLMRKPYILSDRETKEIRRPENAEVRSCDDVITFLKKRLDEGAKSELNRLKELGISTVFPETPIALTIVEHSTSPSGLLDTALQLREEFSDFRAHMAKFEDELLSDDVTLEGKLKRLKQLEALAHELWPTEVRGLRKTTLELSGILTLLPEMMVTPHASKASEVGKRLLEFPLDVLLSHLRRRKVRQMLKARKSFLRSQGWSAKLASVFGVRRGVVEEALLRNRPKSPS